VENPPSGPESQRYSRILVPVDRSDASKTALAYATQFPCSELVLLHVARDKDVTVPNWAVEWADEAKRLRTGRGEVTIEIKTGHVAEQVIEAGADADLIVMMTHGRGAVGRMVFGSVADSVVRKGRTPMLLLRVKELIHSPHRPQRVVVALDRSELAEQALPAGEQLACVLGLPMVLMQVVEQDTILQAVRLHREPHIAPYKQSPTLYDDTRRDVLEEAAQYLDRHASRLRESGRQVETQVLEGTAAFCLMGALTVDDIITMTTQGISGYKRWSIGSVAEKLVREAPCPVLLRHVTECS
jgi:nucleotide-binding universal stress UspA family protein